jgi:competence protein ComEA
MTISTTRPASGLLAFAATSALFLAVALPARATPVNINAADAATIAQGLKGIGLKRAQAIVDYRSKHGPFRSADELAQIKGLGAKVIQKNRADIRLDARGTAPAVAATKPAATVVPKR